MPSTLDKWPLAIRILSWCLSMSAFDFHGFGIIFPYIMIGDFSCSLISIENGFVFQFLIFLLLPGDFLHFKTRISHFLLCLHPGIVSLIPFSLFNNPVYEISFDVESLF